MIPPGKNQVRVFGLDKPPQIGNRCCIYNGRVEVFLDEKWEHDFFQVIYRDGGSEYGMRFNDGGNAKWPPDIKKMAWDEIKKQLTVIHGEVS